MPPSEPTSPADRDNWSVGLLLRYYRRWNGRWRTPTGEAWQPALAIEAVLNTAERTGDVSYRRVVDRSFTRYRGRRSRFYDDDGWYLNAWLRAYDVTGDVRYLDEARALFIAMSAGWDDVCGGGLWWSVRRDYKNAITNELFLLAAAGLHRRTAESGYLDWARRGWDWFEASGLINPAHLVNDGLTVQPDGTGVNNGQTTWTYNQGVLIGALAELWRITGDDGLLRRAGEVAGAAMTTLIHPGGVLAEPTEPSTANRDAQIFKGALAQGLARLHRADPTPAIADFLRANADAVWRGRDPARGVGLSWPGPAGPVNAATHTSATLLLGEVALLAVPT